MAVLLCLAITGETLLERMMRPVSELSGSDSTAAIWISRGGLFFMYFSGLVSLFVIVRSIYHFKQLGRLAGATPLIVIGAAVTIVAALTTAGLFSPDPLLLSGLVVGLFVVATIDAFVARLHWSVIALLVMWLAASASGAYVFYQKHLVLEAGIGDWEHLLLVQRFRNILLFAIAMTLPLISFFKYQKRMRLFPWFAALVFSILAYYFISSGSPAVAKVASNFGIEVATELTGTFPKITLLPLAIFAIVFSLCQWLLSGIAFNRVLGLIFVGLFLCGSAIAWPHQLVAWTALLFLISLAGKLAREERAFRETLGPPISDKIHREYIERLAGTLQMKLSSPATAAMEVESFRVTLPQSELEVDVHHWDGSVAEVVITLGNVGKNTYSASSIDGQWTSPNLSEALLDTLGKSTLAGELTWYEKGIRNRFTPGYNAPLNAPYPVTELSFSSAVEPGHVEILLAAIEELRVLLRAATL